MIKLKRMIIPDNHCIELDRLDNEGREFVKVHLEDLLHRVETLLDHLTGHGRGLGALSRSDRIKHARAHLAQLEQRQAAEQVQSYRDRYDIDQDGVGDRPAQLAQYRDWRACHAAITRVHHRDRDQDRDRHHQRGRGTSHDIG